MKESKPVKFNGPLKDISAPVLLGLYKTMLRVRKLQLEIEKEYPKDEMKTPVHLCLGEEAVSAGVCANLNKKDYVFSNYRGHGHYLAKGGSLNSLVAELYGKEGGCSRSRGGSMHLVDTSVGLMGASAIVAGGIPLATGAALGISLRKERRVSVAFFGDGACDEGVLYESINFAVLKRLPVIYACENNFYAVCSHQSSRQPLDNLYERFKGSSLPGCRVDGNNVVEVYRAARKAVNAARDNKGPSFIEFRTYRLRGHSGGESDVALGYRPQSEMDCWIKRCPLRSFERFLIKKKILDLKKIEAINKHFEKEIRAAFEFAQNSPFPDGNKVLECLYSYGKKA